MLMTAKDINHNPKVDKIIDALEDIKWSLIQHHGLHTLHLCEYPSLDVRQSNWMIVTAVCGQTFDRNATFSDIRNWKFAMRNGELCKRCQKRLESNPNRYT
jgi:hypothetical protein